MKAEELPALLAEIAEVAGLGAALAIAKAKGGGHKTHFPLPENLLPTHWLVELVGAGPAKKICERLGGVAIEVPLGPFSGQRRETWAAIERSLNAGCGTAETARKLGVSRHMVQRHRNGRSGPSRKPKAAPDARQRKLF